MLIDVDAPSAQFNPNFDEIERGGPTVVIALRNLTETSGRRAGLDRSCGGPASKRIHPDCGRQTTRRVVVLQFAMWDKATGRALWG
jgi:hypothetical protein